MSSPRLARWILSRLRRYDAEYRIRGELEEEYRDITVRRGALPAAAWYWGQVLYALPSYLKLSVMIGVSMFKNYWKTALRQMEKHKGYTFINLAGLAVGVACCLLIFVFVRSESSYDDFHQDLARLYRVAMRFDSASLTREFAKVGPPVGPILKRDFPQVESAARLMKLPRPSLRRENRIDYETRGYYAEPGILGILRFDFLAGNPELALVRPGTVVLSDRLARKYFPDEEPLGATLAIDGEDFQVTGIVKNAPENTHLKCDFLASFSTIENDDLAQAWGRTNFYTYLKLAPQANAEDFGRQISRIEGRYRPGGLPSPGARENSYWLQPVKGIHLHSRLAGETEPPGNPLYLYVSASLGLVILLIACVNFINLSTARFASRAKEVGVRKVVGAARGQIVAQFLGESSILAFGAGLAGWSLARWALPLLNGLAGKVLTARVFIQPGTIGITALLVLFIGVVAGGYPAFVLSSFAPAGILKRTLSPRGRGAGLRKALIVGQFAVTSFLLAGTLIVFIQVRFMKNADRGFSKEQKLVLPLKGELLKDDKFEAIKSEMASLPQVLGATVSSGVPGYGLGAWATAPAGADDLAKAMAFLFLDHDFIAEYQIPILAGRSFSRDRPGDRNDAFLINESAVRALGWANPEEALGKRLTGKFKGAVIGVVRNFNFDGLQRGIEPLIMGYGPDKNINMFSPTGSLTLTLRTGGLEETLSRAKKIWEKFNPDIPYSFFFIDEMFERYYRAETQIREFFGVFAFLGLFIACLGLFGLASFTAERRRKEIGIRKVLGASASGVAWKMSGEFAKGVLLANGLAGPAVYFVMTRWLEQFATRISIGPSIFAATVVLTLGIALLTVGFQTVKAAQTDPVEALRCE
jgi:putative ABC transport system permease protein